MVLDAFLKGFGGELKTRFINWLFLGENYTIFNNILVSVDEVSTQIDHVIVSKYGIFAVETKDKTGWIFGDEYKPEWTQVIFGKKYHFPNPLRQNYRHTRCLAELLDIEDTKIHSLVIFWGDCEFKTKMPENVIKGGLFNGKFKNYVFCKREILLNQEEITRICDCLTEAKNNSGILSGFKHIKNLKERYSSETKCPKCGGDLIKRISSKGENAGQYFLGCSNFPRCKYIKHI
jgi:hypothetical protein